MAGEVATAIGAVRWYRNHGDGQYEGANIERYDTAARTLTGREQFASEFMDHVGGASGATLEIAAGTGIISEALQKHSADVTYTDIEEPAINVLRQRLGNAVILQADFFDLPLNDQAFDTVVGVGFYRYVQPERRQEFWDEMHRVTKPGARLLIGQFYPRGFALKGNDIDRESDLSQPLFSLDSVRQTLARIHLGPVRLRSGEYKSLEFTRNE